jgi:hypothetical protein
MLAFLIFTTLHLTSQFAPSESHQLKETGMQKPESSRVTVKLQASVVNKRLIVTLRAENHTAADILVEPYFFKSELKSENIIAADKRGEKVEYIGKLAKRLKPALEDYVRIKPGESRSQDIDISDAYDFKSAKSTYTLTYKSVDADPLTGKIGQRLSNTVKIDFKP